MLFLALLIYREFNKTTNLLSLKFLICSLDFCISFSIAYFSDSNYSLIFIYCCFCFSAKVYAFISCLYYFISSCIFFTSSWYCSVCWVICYFASLTFWILMEFLGSISKRSESGSVPVRNVVSDITLLISEFFILSSFYRVAFRTSNFLDSRSLSFWSYLRFSRFSAMARWRSSWVNRTSILDFLALTSSFSSLIIS